MGWSDEGMRVLLPPDAMAKARAMATPRAWHQRDRIRGVAGARSWQLSEHRSRIPGGAAAPRTVEPIVGSLEDVRCRHIIRIIT